MSNGLYIVIANIIICTLLSYFIAPLVKRIVIKFNIIDLPNSRKIHKLPIVRVGGLSIFTTFIFIILQQRFFFDSKLLSYSQIDNFSVILIGACLFFLIGIHDDVFKSSPLLRLFLQFLVAFFISLFGVNFGALNFSLPYFGNFNFIFPRILNYIFTSFWIVGITNALNWIDGIDALAAGYGSIVSFGLFLLMIIKGDFVGAVFFSILFGSILGFLIRNFKPAFYIMGDCGSNFLGFCLSTSTLFFLKDKALNSINIFYLLLLFSLPIGDMLIVLIGRLFQGKNIFLPDKTHLHHKLINLNFEYKNIIFIMYSYSTFSVLLSIFFMRNF